MRQMPLPPGQRERSDFPRFGLRPFAFRFPRETTTARIEVRGEVERVVEVGNELADLPRVEQTSDFHCVTTWSCRALPWSGFRFADFFERFVRAAGPSPEATWAHLKAQDGYRTRLPLEDLLAPDVLLADRLDGAPLTVAHGAPLRIVAPAHYGYKSLKHLARLDLRRDERVERPSGLGFMDHPRARVALEERAVGGPGWLFRRLYRPLVAGNVARFRRALDAYEKGELETKP
jgi:DMSO/TMAO reductase YedYZ molybdopterin-dependent catalytic subunit